MAYDKTLIDKIKEALANTDKNTNFYFDKKNKKVLEVKGKPNGRNLSKFDLVKIEPMLEDIAELMEDFALEQEAEDVQDYLYKVLDKRNTRTSVINFRRVLHDYPKSKKKWAEVEKDWLKERAEEFLEDMKI